jgi:hypothetical protein
MKEQLEDIQELRFIFTSPTSLQKRLQKKKGNFNIPRLEREKKPHGTQFEVKLRNELTRKQLQKNALSGFRKKVPSNQTLQTKTWRIHEY